MITLLAPSLQERVIHLIQKRTKLPVSKLKPTAHLYQDLGLDALQIVEIIWDLEKRFQVEIPDDVPLQTVCDFIHFLATQGK
ncbi:acyl carrier protein [Nibribacter koreensis]|uniref:Carrier domain-containing protein n=1 Tax=Nibribacter koreensis TaxID=1084519 RepID=A0ABP8F4G6_9BACT